MILRRVHPLILVAAAAGAAAAQPPAGPDSLAGADRDALCTALLFGHIGRLSRPDSHGILPHAGAAEEQRNRLRVARESLTFFLGRLDAAHPRGTIGPLFAGLHRRGLNTPLAEAGLRDCLAVARARVQAVSREAEAALREGRAGAAETES